MVGVKLSSSFKSFMFQNQNKVVIQLQQLRVEVNVQFEVHIPEFNSIIQDVHSNDDDGDDDDDDEAEVVESRRRRNVAAGESVVARSVGHRRRSLSFWRRTCREVGDNFYVW